MNESEARRAALTAAVAWCSTPSDTDVSTDAMLEYAEQFETWLLRPSVNVEVSVDGSGTWCPACNIVVAWCVHTTTVDSVPVNVPEQREAPRTRPNPWCSYCEHGPHAGPTCVYCACTGRAPEQEQRGVECTDCGHGPHGDGPCEQTVPFGEAAFQCTCRGPRGDECTWTGQS